MSGDDLLCLIKVLVVSSDVCLSGCGEHSAVCFPDTRISQSADEIVSMLMLS